MEKRLQAVRSRLRKLDDIEDESMLSENEDAQLNYMKEVIKHVISNGTATACMSEDEFVVPEELIDEVVEMLYDISNIFYQVRNISVNACISILSRILLHILEISTRWDTNESHFVQ